MVKRILEKPLDVIFFKLCQQLFSLYAKLTNYWENRLFTIQEFWTNEKIKVWKDRFNLEYYLISPSSVQEFLLWGNSNSIWYSQIREIATNTLNGKIIIFDTEYDFAHSEELFPWTRDWRFNHVWESGKSNYQFYERDKATPYDVKFPWELSRLGFLLPVAETALISDEKNWKEYCFDVVQDWSDQNPAAKSVNWYPMESSIRVINLGFILLLLAGIPSVKHNELSNILKIITIHGDYIFKNIEYSDIRGNHYLANIIALLFVGHLLKDIYHPANKWFAYARVRLEGELLLQYLIDGVNFEKSVPYHRLVTELSLLGMMILEKEVISICDETKNRIKESIHFIDAYIRPDGLAPNIGDNDSARIFNFDPVPLRDHSTLLLLGAAFFSEPGLMGSNRISSAPSLLLGDKGALFIERNQKVSTQRDISVYFPEGGFFISKNDRHYLFADYGEVGLKGRGGHGHNDLFSFELTIDKKPIVIDPGTPTYTGDLDTHRQYRSTSFHNTVCVDDTEIADFMDHWRISDEADPFNVEYHIQESFDVIQGEHQGYSKLEDPVFHKRKIQFNKISGELICEDSIDCIGYHKIERILHFNHDLNLSLEEQLIRISFDDLEIGFVECNDADCMIVEPFYQSDNYGHTILSKKIIMKNSIHGSRDLIFRIYPSGGVNNLTSGNIHNRWC